MHVTSKLVAGLPELRDWKCYRVIWNALKHAGQRPGRRADGEFRVIEYSIQSNHLHLFVEASDKDALARGMQGLKISIAKGLNQLWERGGELWADRYHNRSLRTPREVRNALRYLLDNARRHGRRWRYGDGKVRPDPFSSGLWFDGWRNYAPDGFLAAASPAARARSWLARVGWRRHGLLLLQVE